MLSSLVFCTKLKKTLLVWKQWTPNRFRLWCIQSTWHILILFAFFFFDNLMWINYKFSPSSIVCWHVPWFLVFTHSLITLLNILQGDHVTFLNVYNGFLQSSKSSKWCHKNFINYHSMVNLNLVALRCFILCIYTNIQISKDLLCSV